MSIELKDVKFTYMKKTPFEKTALKNINLKIEEGEFLAITGHTGSGKSTLIQLIAGLIKPTQGQILIDEIDLNSREKKSAQSKIGIVFQYPESQLFEETVEKDISFGPKNLNLTKEEILKRVDESMELVGLSKDCKKKSPFEMSGGQKRKAAIAGVLAMRPKYLILDEPIAGLDPKSRDEIMNNIKKLHDEKNVTIILISHSMDDVAKFASRVLIMNGGEILTEGKPREIFSKEDILKAAGLSMPSAKKFLMTLKASGLNISTDAITIDEAEEILNQFGKNSS